MTSTAVRTILGSAMALTGAVVPVFLLGALSVQIRAELGFGQTALGATITGFFLAGAVSAVPGGRLAERMGARRALLVGVTIGSGSTVLVAALASAWWHLVVLYCAAGTATGLVDPGAARALAYGVPRRLQGLAFGMKEASVPAASLAAGVAVPVLGVTVGWRPAFLVAALAAPLVWLVTPRDAPVGTGTGGRPGNRVAAATPLVLTSAGAALAVGAATAMATFLVPAAVSRGFSSGAAGVLLVGGSLLAITMRLAVGWAADRTTRSQLAVVAMMMTAGAIGLLALTAEASPLLVLGTAIGFGLGWGWTGLLFLSAVRASAGAPASAAGIVLTGLAIGGALGPLVFGALVEAQSPTVAWVAAAVAMGSGGGLVALGDALLRSRAGDAGLRQP